MVIRFDQVRSLPDFVREVSADYGDAPALCDRSGKYVLRYNDLPDRMIRGATSLHEQGIDSGNVIMLVDAGPDWACTLFALLEAGCVAVPLPVDTAPEVIAGMATCVNARGIVHSKRFEAIAGQLTIPAIDLDHFYAESAHSTSNPLCGDEVCLLAFTSGSIQNPRAVELSHRSLLRNAEAVLKARASNAGTAVLSMLPPAHLFELVVGLLIPLACGARVVYSGSLLPNRVIDSLREHEISHAVVVPALVECLFHEVAQQLIEAGIGVGNSLDLTPRELVQRLESELTANELAQLRSDVRARVGDSLQSLVVGGAALDPALAELVTMVGINIEIGYGLTEAGPVVSMGVAGQAPWNSVGRPLPGVRVKISDSEEILVRSPCCMRGYFQNDDATSIAFTDRWLHTGDRGHLDADGYLFVNGRLKEALVTGAGRTIYPEEVEPYYRSVLFHEWCVTGLSGPDGNDLPTLFVVPASQNFERLQLETEFQRLRAAAPAQCFVPEMRVIERLPKTATGKVKRRWLANHHGDSKG
jgi:long-chain acyl-CoA synthetase